MKTQLTGVAVVRHFGVQDRLLVVMELEVLERALHRRSVRQIDGTLAMSRVALSAPLFWLCNINDRK